MRRNISALTEHQYDLLIIGGGISGAFIAWDAALRGLSVALIERGDFGQATSANSLRIVHGGLRYLKDGDIRLVRRMIRERQALLRIAPHLVQPLPCLMPTYHNFGQSRELMAAALLLNDLISYDRNVHGDPARLLPQSRIITREEALQLAPGLPDAGLTGGALWYDAQMYSSERLTLAVIRSAAQSGAAVANYVRAEDLRFHESRVVGAHARDVLTGAPLTIGARLVVNAAGPWVGDLAGRLWGKQRPAFQLSTAMNLVTRQIIAHTALGVSTGHGPRQASSGKGRMLFIAPWRGYSLIGTAHEPYCGHPDGDRVSRQELERFIDEVNRAYPTAALSHHDLLAVQRGFLPAAINMGSGPVRLLRQGQIYDHQRQDGIDGLLTAVGVKYTTARYLAEQVVDRALHKLGRRRVPCVTDRTPVFGGQIDRLAEFVRQAERDHAAHLSPTTLGELVRHHGSAYPGVLACANEAAYLAHPLSATTPVLAAEVVYAVREEMAQHLSDVILRRVGVGLPAQLEPAILQRCAEMMGHELGWSASQRRRELGDLLGSAYSADEPLIAREVGGAPLAVPA